MNTWVCSTNKWFKKFKSKWMVETWLRVQPFHGEGVVSAILVDNFIGKRKKKKSKTFDFFWFCRFGYQWGRKKGIPKEARRIIAERKHRRLEKKENWKTQKKQGNDKVCAFHFYFILWTWCVLGLHNVNAPIFFFFFFYSFSLTCQTQLLYFLCRADFGFKEQQFPAGFQNH